MKRSAYVMLAGFWLCLSPYLQIDDGTLPLPRQDQLLSVDNGASVAADDSIWNLLCR